MWRRLTRITGFSVSPPLIRRIVLFAITWSIKLRRTIFEGLRQANISYTALSSRAHLRIEPHAEDANARRSRRTTLTSKMFCLEKFTREKIISNEKLNKTTQKNLICAVSHTTGTIFRWKCHFTKGRLPLGQLWARTVQARRENTGNVLRSYGPRQLLRRPLLRIRY